MNRTLALLAALALVSGCTPTIVSSNPRSVEVVNVVDGPSFVAAAKLADEHCKKYGRYAVRVQDAFQDGLVQYQCVQ